MSLPKPYYEHAGIVIYHGDCREILPSLKADVVVTDPPYGIRAARRGSGGTQNGAALAPSRDYGDMDWDDKPIDSALLGAILSCAPFAGVFGGNYYALPPSRGWLIWDKDNGSNHYSDCELMWTNLDAPARRLRYRWHGMLQEPGFKEDRWHPTQKPLAVMLWILRRFPDGLVLDPFMGSGTTLVAAKQLGRQAIGIEIEERYCEIAVKRLAQESLPLEPPEPQPEQAGLLP